MIAERFREEGADVLVADLGGGDVEVDVRDASLVAQAVDTVVERLGGSTRLSTTPVWSPAVESRIWISRCGAT
ncbi:MAG: hypothetical protein ACRDST_21335 [Pseudonocardiaceae bacterium]